MRILVILSLIFSCSYLSAQEATESYQLVWSDEFEDLKKPNPEFWSYENGFVRNEEHQWYQEDNAFIENGLLVIEGRKEKVKNTNFNPESSNWRQNREYAEYTASSINSRGKFEFQYGRLEVRARIDTAVGLWPAIWTLGVNGEWPSNGEIDVMESYPSGGVPSILANVAWGTNRRYTAHWDSKVIPHTYFVGKDSEWPSKFHIWRMDWDEHYIRLYLDDELLNETDLSKTINADGSNPFHQPHYILLNLAIGGQNGGDPTRASYPNRYEIDYVRVYQKK